MPFLSALEASNSSARAAHVQGFSICTTSDGARTAHVWGTKDLQTLVQIIVKPKKTEKYGVHSWANFRVKFAASRFSFTCLLHLHRILDHHVICPNAIDELF